MSHRGGINRAFSWIKKVLEVTEVTTVPERVLSEVQPSVDLFGWERFEEVATENVGLANTASVAGTIVPADVNRLYIAASVESDDIVNQLTYWIEMFPLGGDSVPVTPPVTPPINGATSFVRAGGLPRPFLVGPGGTARGRCAPATAGGTVLRVRLIFIDISLGEYIPAL